MPCRQSSTTTVSTKPRRCSTGLKHSQLTSWLGAEQRWTVSHLKTSIQVLKRGLGFAWVPREHIREELSEGLLKPLPMEEGAVAHQELYLIFADRDSAGPATRELASVLRQICDTLHLR